MTLTTHLLTTHPPTSRATAHPFLTSAGNGTIPTHLLSAWLAQDRLYAQSYIRFIGHLLAKIDLPLLPPSPNHQPPPSSSPSENAKNKEENEKKKEKTRQAHTKTASTLSACLSNILTELAFFDSVAKEYALDLTPYVSFPSPSTTTSAGTTPTSTSSTGESKKGPNPTTQSYMDLFVASSASPTASLLEGLVVLYATELCYLRAWRHAEGVLSERLRGEIGGGENDADGGALRRLIPNWASREFEAFVGAIGEVVDLVAEAEGVGLSLGEGEQGEDVDVDVDGLLGRCERWWRQVVWLEERFWPDVE